MKKYKLYLFDFDGTLFNTEKALEYIFCESFKSVGITVKPEDAMFISRIPLSESYKLYGGKDEDIPTFSRTIEETLASDESVRRTVNYPETEEFLTYMRNNKIQCGIVTSNNVPHVKVILDHLKVPESTFDVYVGNRETPRHKPAPDPILIALKLANYDGDLKDVVYVGDGLNDMVAANAAGVDAILIDRINEHPDGNYLKIKSLLELIK